LNCICKKLFVEPIGIIAITRSVNVDGNELNTMVALALARLVVAIVS
jgi:hypothetical protein